MDSSRLQFELAAVEQDADAVIGELAEAKGRYLIDRMRLLKPSAVALVTR